MKTKVSEGPILRGPDMTILNKIGKNNVAVYFLSRHTSNDNEPCVEDYFHDEYLFSVSTNSPWFTDITNYLVASRISHYLSPKEKQNIIKLSYRFSWIEDCLFYIEVDLIMRRCVQEDEIHEILKYFHDDLCGGKFAEKRTGYKEFHKG
jgi:hypothetical protein